MTFTPHWFSKLERPDITLKLLLAALAVYWLCMLPSLLGNAAAPGTAASRALTLPAMALMYWVAAAKTTQLSRALAVLGQLLAPHALQRELMREKMRFMALTWVFLATGATLQLALPQSGVSAIGGAALISAAACLGMLRSLSMARLLARPFARLFDAAPYLAAVALIVLDLNRLLDRVGNLPLPVLAFVAAAFPCMTLWLAHRWRAALPAWRWSAPASRLVIAGWLAMHVNRFSILTWSRAESFRDGQSNYKVQSNIMRVTALAAPFLVLRPVWVNGQVQLFGAMMLLLASLVIAGGLVVRDLHWRSLLMPGGMRPRRVASHILASTLSVQFAAVLVATAVLVAGAHVVLAHPAEKIVELLMRSSMLLVELVFATTLALVLRAATTFALVLRWPASIARILGVFTTVVVMTILVRYFISMANLPTQFPLALPVYLLALPAASALLLMLANRLWTAEKLFVQAGRSATGG